jgi:aconitate hydratase A / 2-methylisocitrate dehydratase
VGLGILPLQFLPGESIPGLGLTGLETFDVLGVSDGIEPRQQVRVVARGAAGQEVAFGALLRIDGQAEVDYYRHGGILQMVLREMLSR